MVRTGWRSLDLVAERCSLEDEADVAGDRVVPGQGHGVHPGVHPGENHRRRDAGACAVAAAVKDRVYEGRARVAKNLYFCVLCFMFST